MEETWKIIDGYDGKYSISNYGRVKNNKRNIYLGHKGAKYMQCALGGSGFCKRYAIHLLVWDYFGNAKRDNKLQVDHIDENKLNNRIDNLQLLTNRGNVIKSIVIKSKKTQTGVHWSERLNSWVASIMVNGGKVSTYFETKQEAIQKREWYIKKYFSDLK